MRPHTIPAKLKPLTDAQFAQLHTWLDDLTYKKVRQNLLDRFGIDMSDSALCRYNQTRDLARHTVEHKEGSEQVRDLLAIMNGQPVPYSEAGIELVMKRAFDLATAREMTPAKLATLLKIFHYKKNCEWTERRHLQNERRLAQADTRNEISSRLAGVREQELSLKKSRPPGSPPTDSGKLWSPEELPIRQAEVEARIQADPLLRQIGLPPQDYPLPTTGDPVLSDADSLTSTSAETSDLSLTPDFQSGEVTPSDHLTASAVSPAHPPREAPDSKCQMKNAQCSMLNESPTPNSTDTSQRTPRITETLEQRVNKYTLARYHEALIGKDSTKVGRSAAWNFISALQHCPCGKHLPCPDHGDFPPYFWELFPDDPDYFRLLLKKNLPFTSVHELLRREAEQFQVSLTPDFQSGDLPTSDSLTASAVSNPVHTSPEAPDFNAK